MIYQTFINSIWHGYRCKTNLKFSLAINKTPIHDLQRPSPFYVYVFSPKFFIIEKMAHFNYQYFEQKILKNELSRGIRLLWWIGGGGGWFFNYWFFWFSISGIDLVEKFAIISIDGTQRNFRKIVKFLTEALIMK